MHDRISVSVLVNSADAIAETNHGLGGPKIVKYCNGYAVRYDVVIPHASYPFTAANKRTALYENLQKFPPHAQYDLLMEMCDDPQLAGNEEVQAAREILQDRYSHLGSARQNSHGEATEKSGPVSPPSTPPWIKAIKPPLTPPPIANLEQIRPYDIFLSYAHEDEASVTFVRSHLMALDRQNKIRKWWDREISAGREFADDISMQLLRSDIILLFVSASFLASDFCYQKEMSQALKQHEEGRSVVIPVILRHCDWHETPLGKLMALPRDGRPLATWPDRDEGGTDIAKGVKRVVADLQRRQTSQGA